MPLELGSGHALVFPVHERPTFVDDLIPRVSLNGLDSVMDSIVNRFGVEAINEDAGCPAIGFGTADSARSRYAKLEVVASIGVVGTNGNVKPTVVVVRVSGFMRGEHGPTVVVIGFERVYNGANHDWLRHITEGFYDTALNEANDVRTTKDCTKASERCQKSKVCRRPSVKTMLADAYNRQCSFPCQC